jgi:hypothetical protein
MRPSEEHQVKLAIKELSRDCVASAIGRLTLLMGQEKRLRVLRGGAGGLKVESYRGQPSREEIQAKIIFIPFIVCHSRQEALEWAQEMERERGEEGRRTIARIT